MSQGWWLQANRRFIVAPGDEAALGAALLELAGDAALRKEIGAANREMARADI